MQKLFLEDLQVGQKFVSGVYALSEEAIIEFARQYDPQLFHLDAEQAKTTFFHGLAASGWHTAAITMRLIVESVPLADGVIGAGGEIAWPQPTRPDDVLRVESEILEIKPSRSRPDRAIVSVLCETKNQRGEVLQRLSPKLVVFKKPGG